MIETKGRNLVFLFSLPRSGSTLLSAILSMHPSILCPNEPWFMLALASFYQSGNITYARYEHSLCEKALEELVSRSEFNHAAREFALSIYRQSLDREKRSIFVDKTPRYYHILDFIHELFPEAKKIWLKRNPLDVAASYLTTWNLSVEKLVDPTYGPVALDIPLGLHRLRSFFNGRPQTYEVAYEDLVREPTNTMRALCGFMGIGYVENMENYGADQAAMARRRRLTMGDTSIFNHVSPHAASVGRWKQVLKAEQVQALLGCIGEQTLRRMGYGNCVEQLTSEGFWFPDEATVDKNISTFVSASHVLPWAPQHLQ